MVQAMIRDEAPQVKPQLTPEQDKNLKLFLEKNKDRIAQWKASHPENVFIPVGWDESRQMFFWMNRKARRA